MTNWLIRFSLLLFVSMIWLLTGCSDSALHSERRSFEDHQWNWGDHFNTRFEVVDTAQSYDLLLDLKHGDDYNYQNLYLSVSTEFPSDTVVTSLLPIDLARKNGQWYGRCRGGSCRLRIYLQEGVKFDQPGQYSIDFEQYTRQKSLKSMEGISFTIKTSQS